MASLAYSRLDPAVIGQTRVHRTAPDSTGLLHTPASSVDPVYTALLTRTVKGKGRFRRQNGPFVLKMNKKIKKICFVLGRTNVSYLKHARSDGMGFVSLRHFEPFTIAKKTRKAKEKATVYTGHSFT